MEGIPKRKPAFTRDQIVSPADVQRKWRSVVEPKLAELGVVHVFSGASPRTTISSYESFEKLWQQAQEAQEVGLRSEILERVMSLLVSKSQLVPFAEVLTKAGLTVEDLEGTDVDLE